MHILLPPSEGKSAPSDGPALDFDSLVSPELDEARRRVVKELVSVSKRNDAARILGAGARAMPEVIAQRELFSLPCAPAREVYTGVLYEVVRLKPGDRVLIFSGLFGVTGGEDLIPDYRLSMNARLPEIGSLKAYWRRELKAWRPGDGDSGSEDSTGLVVDMRSEAYRVTSHDDVPWWTMRVIDTNGKVISHMAKRYRGLLTRLLLDEQTRDPSHDPDVAEVARSLGNVRVEAKDMRRMLILTPYSL